MKSIIKFLSIIFAVATILAAIYFLWTYRQHYGDWDKKGDISNILSQYTISPASTGDTERISSPKLPDITPYTVQAIKDKTPEVKPGHILVVGIAKGYRKMRNRLSYFGEMQGRLDPLSLVVASGVYDLDAITKEVADPSIIEKRDDKTYILYVPLMVRAAATLLIQEGETLLLSSTNGALLTTFGDIFITKAEVKGWDTAEDKPALFTDSDSFRPYLTAWCGAHLNISQSKISYLGYQSSKSYGVTYTSCTDTLYREDYSHLPGATGWIIDSEFRDVYFGFYSYEADDIVILRNLYEDNIVYGIDPHDRSTNLIIAYNTARGSKQKHGIIISREVSDSYIFKNIAEFNAGSGIMIDRNSHGNIIAYNTAQNNMQDGLVFYESSNNISYNNNLLYNGKNGLRIRNSWGIVSQGDIINYNGGVGVKVYSLYLTSDSRGADRDLELDPYVEKSGASIIDVEMTGNKSSNFKLENSDYLKIFSPNFFESPSSIFSGDLKGIDNQIMGDLLDTGIDIRSKKEVY